MAILGVIYSAAGGAWLLMPPDWQPTLAEPVRWVLAIIGVSLAAAPGVSRVIAQPKLADKIADQAKVVDNAEHA
ncbi:hypothetical protein EAH88_11920 [Rhodanobacter glycinis]|uniref:Holin n=1 Tax=Rhodanobacter glycinis TaxID=582702 RepID=A0A502C997_9GAMM|nr:hypothetical protein [Rhodanobacter glycinis]TPG08331.1 hypothetical protein EAH88_11920 [Rhodanobacter glycinis]